MVRTVLCMREAHIFPVECQSWVTILKHRVQINRTVFSMDSKHWVKQRNGNLSSGLTTVALDVKLWEEIFTVFWVEIIAYSNDCSVKVRHLSGWKCGFIGVTGKGGTNFTNPHSTPLDSSILVSPNPSITDSTKNKFTNVTLKHVVCPWCMSQNPQRRDGIAHKARKLDYVASCKLREEINVGMRERAWPSCDDFFAGL